MIRFLGDEQRPRGEPDAFAAKLRDVLAEGSMIEGLITTSMTMDGVMDVVNVPLVQGLSSDD